MYQVLYRKWRPKTFDDVVGQSHITTTLKNEIIQSKTAHAYLFTGSRGTGKTSCAKILSKAVNCLSSIDGNPCGNCQNCIGIENGSIMDVVEIDAASNNGVDNIRELRDEANFTPSTAKYRVYIIDEAHMLSTGAFNALLKILEEPPKHLMFILATTEVNKIPATILSRCQRFDFKRIDNNTIAKRLTLISKAENVTLSEEAAGYIARLADGGLRDAISLFDQVCSITNNIDTDSVRKSAGLADKETFFSIVDYIISKDLTSAFTITNELHNQSKSLEGLANELLEHFRNLLIIKTIPNYKSLIPYDNTDLEKAKTQSDRLLSSDIFYYISVIKDFIDNSTNSNKIKLSFEVILIKLCTPTLDSSSTSLLKRIEQLENIVKSISFTEENSLKPKKSLLPEEIIQEEVIISSSDEKTTIDKAKNSINENTELVTVVCWPEILERLKEISPPTFGFLSDSSAFFKGNFVLISSPNSMFIEMIKKDNYSLCIREAIFRETGIKYKLGITKSAPTNKTADSNTLVIDNILNMAKLDNIDIKIILKS